MPAATARTRLACTAWLLALSPFGGVAHAAEAVDVCVAGGDVRTGGPIRGDFGAAGGKVLLDEPVAGDAWLTGGSVEVRAPVRDRLARRPAQGRRRRRGQHRPPAWTRSR